VQTHLGLLALFALFVSIVFAVLMRDDRREQLRFGSILFGAFVIGAVVAGWLMLPFPI
jgi:heme/copper-type cytochrome/quinol oxidase subunit 4